MPATVTCKALSYSTPDGRFLFQDLNLSFGACRTGLVGRNGTGKSTLLKLIVGELTPSSGSVSVTGTWRMLRQSVQVAENAVISDVFEARDALARLARIEAGEGTEDDFDRADWSLPARIDMALGQLGLAGMVPDRPLSTLSGGQRTRLALAALVFDAPDMILMDEPTNNLDADGGAAVAELLAAWRGTAIVVSHDRELLRRMDAIVELTTLGASTFGGNYDFYAERKAVELAAAEQTLETAERKLVDLGRRVQAQKERKARRDSAGARKAAKGDMPKIMIGGRRENSQNTAASEANLATRMRAEAEQAAIEARSEIEILQHVAVKLNPTGLAAGKTILEASGLTGGPDPDDQVIRNVSLRIVGPERVAITGRNGSGKTSLLRLITGDLAPVSGYARINGRFALLDQTVGNLDPALSIRDNFRAINPEDDENAGRAALARFMFRADAALQVVGSLSGGEMLRAGLAVTLGGRRPPELLILDEPTNHLDLAAIAAVEAGLSAYDGALLVVSHDRDFLAAIGVTREIEL